MTTSEGDDSCQLKTTCSYLLLLVNCHCTAQVNLVLDDAVEFTPDPMDKTKAIRTELNCEILLNGNQIAVLVPGGAGPPDSLVAAYA